MKVLRIALVLLLVAAAGGALVLRDLASAQAQTIKIGVLYDHTGPFSAAGSLNCWRGAKMMIDLINERGGVLGKYKIVQVDGDGQSKAEVAINEAERLLNVEKVDILAGIYSSAHAVPLAEKVDKQKRFLWITTAISSKVFDGRNLQYTFRPQPTSMSTRRRSSRSPPRSCAWPSSTRTAPMAPTWPWGTSSRPRSSGSTWSSRKATRSAPPISPRW